MADVEFGSGSGLKQRASFGLDLEALDLDESGSLCFEFAARET